MKDPGPLLWGVATSDHQSEAYEERYRDIRDDWEERVGETPRGRATDFWNRYPEDVDLARGLGCTAFRFSVSWARVEPDPGQYDSEALEHYRSLAAAIRAAGMEPVLTLHHFTWPRHVEARGGMTAAEFPGWFREYSRQVAVALGDLVRIWVTFNEPTLLPFGYLKPWWQSRYSAPPGRPGRSDGEQLDDVAALIRNLFRAHAAARAEIRTINPEALVGSNPFILGLPGWLNGLMDWALSRHQDPERWKRREQRVVYRTPLAQGGADVVLAMVSDTPQRERRVLLSQPYYTTRLAVVIPSSSLPTRLEEFSGPVAVVSGTSAEERVGRFLPQSRPLTVRDAGAALAALDAGDAAGWLTDAPLAKAWIRRRPAHYRQFLIPGSCEQYAAAVAGGDQDLLAAVDAAIIEFLATGEWDRSTALHVSYGEVDAPTRPEAVPQGAGGVGHRPGGVLAAVRSRGRLRVAVRADAPGFSERDRKTGELRGLEIDLARALARSILGSPDRIEFVVTPAHRRLSVLRSFWRCLVEPVQRFLALFSTILNTNWWHLGMAGRLPAFLCPPECVGMQDYAGFDYYWGVGSLQVNRVLQLVDSMQQRFETAPVWPAGLTRLLDYHARLFPDLPILIIENGCVDRADGITRAEYLRRHIAELHGARSRGVRVQAYFWWSITSNREWGLPFSRTSDFGLYHVELDQDPDLKRVETETAEAYREVIAAGSAENASATRRK